MEMETLEMLINLIEENFTIDTCTRYCWNALNQPMIKIAVCKIGYSIVDNQDGTFEVGVMGEDVLLTFPNITAEDVVAVITKYSNKQLQYLMDDRNALKHGMVGVPVTMGDIENIKR